MDTIALKSSQVPWNKGKIVDSQPSLRTKEVWSIRTRPQIEGRIRDLAFFDLAIDSRLRGCDVVRLRVEDVAPHGATIDRATVRQPKTGHPVRFEPTEQIREAVDQYIRSAGRKPGEFLFPSARPLHVDRAVRPVGLEMDSRHRPRSGTLRHPFATPNQGYPDLQANRKSSRRPASSWTSQNREHGPVSRDRGR